MSQPNDYFSVNNVAGTSAFTPVTAQPAGNSPAGIYPPYPPPYSQPSAPALLRPSQPPPPPPVPVVPVYRDPSIPPGLEYLTVVDQLIVKQRVEVLEVLSGFETNNKYTVTNNMGQQVYYAEEVNDCCTRNCFGSMRPFEMKIFDNRQEEIMRIRRPFRCCTQELQVTSRTGQLLGTVKENWSLFTPMYSVKDPAGGTVLKIHGPFCGPCCTLSCCGSDVEFDVLSLVGQHKIGRISKKWSGLARELYTDADFFGVSFPMDLNVYTKAVLLAATFLIDFMFFESDC